MKTHLLLIQQTKIVMNKDETDNRIEIDKKSVS